jgi:hypothetical protein
MSTSSMRKENNPPIQSTAPLQVLVVGGNGTIVVYPNSLKIPWKFVGTVQWTLAGEADTVFTGTGIIDDPDSPFTSPIFINPRLCEASVDNTNKSKTGKRSRYEVTYRNALGPQRHDPTVENDSPPPVPAS